ncbi:hypothetical protein [Pseudonocardia adelaidensis]|uniref:EfeO-type cupredoxin-like domain-containing protein n=1 Tax=Pseudonocardia adelaidensis TaxID=648754 RepID=A0ABP9NQ28_9PSEU
MGHPTHRRGGYAGVSPALLVSVLVAFGLGWVGATLAGAGTRAADVAAPPPPATAPAAPTTTSAPVAPVGFAQPTVNVEGLEVMSVLTKIKGGVDVTLLVQNHGDTPITVDNATLGPHDVTFRGQPVAIEMAPARKKLSPGEALVYPCRVHLPDMNLGELSFTVGGVPVSGQAAGD